MFSHFFSTVLRGPDTHEQTINANGVGQVITGRFTHFRISGVGINLETSFPQLSQRNLFPPETTLLLDVPYGTPLKSTVRSYLSVMTVVAESHPQ
ncbi:hypothetical protein GAP31_088 [Cronobacter phage vB_CsaM_GAP31]|uniref:Uncharacterized protein n=1 Tax=Cronobacter phage vB_CsaM_GAP31 TaxID=1141135 RepID=K4F6P4_9CAUD|nr:hypothetical protein GAP31_088 [Cronobacter phage vB_CsaM_GAP31]AFC21267.1 hypothetical protein GAP31_088 [Cronobacter phage vB_CsaM_GAP31]